MAVFANLRKGTEEIKKAATRSGGGGGFIPELRWKDDGEVHYVLFLQSADEIPTVLYHKMMDCGTKDDKTMWRSFISRRDPNIDGPSGYDPLDDRGYKPTNRSIGLVVEMERTKKNGKDHFVPMERTFTRKDDDGNEEEVTEPAVYLVIEAPSTFYSPITSFADEVGPIEDQVFLIKRVGKSTDTSYNPIAMQGKTFDVPEDEVLASVLTRLESYVEDLASEDRMRELVEGLPEDHVFNKYAKLKGNKKGGSSKSSGRFSEKAAPKAKTSDDSEGESKPKKRSRFDELKAEITGN